MIAEITTALIIGVLIGIFTGIKNTYPELNVGKNDGGHNRTTNEPQGFFDRL
ncbi:MAG: hypothetical protein ABIJ34_03835 [archaeon]